MKEIQDTYNSFLVVDAFVEPLEYHETPVENVKLLVREVTEKNEAFTSVQAYLSKGV